MEIRALKKSDIDDIGDLLKTRNNSTEEIAQKRKTLFEWIAFHNPQANGETTYFGVEEDGKIIAFHGRMPAEFIINGKLKRGYFVHDLYVDPEYRKKGYGFFLTMRLAKEIEKKSDSFFCLIGMTALNLQMQRKRDYPEMMANGYVKFFNPKEQMLKKLKMKLLVFLINPFLILLNYLFDVIKFVLHKNPVKVFPIDRFDNRIDELNTILNNEVGICSNKSAVYLNWKYVDRPFSKDKVLIAEKDGKVSGYVVLMINPYKTEFIEGAIVDIMAHPKDTETISMLIIKTIQYFRSQKVYAVRCILSDNRFVEVFKKFLFIEKKKGKSVMIGNLKNIDSIENKEKMLDINNWHITYGESDAFMLAP